MEEAMGMPLLAKILISTTTTDKVSRVAVNDNCLFACLKQSSMKTRVRAEFSHLRKLRVNMY